MAGGTATNDRWYLEQIAVLLGRILEKLDIPISNTLFYGSSAGGYMSMCLAAMLRSRVTVINPQFIVENSAPPCGADEGVLSQGGGDPPAGADQGDLCL